MILFKPKPVSVNDQIAQQFVSYRSLRPGSRSSPRNSQNKLNDSGDRDAIYDTFKNPKANIRTILTSNEVTEEDAWYIFQQVKHYKFFMQFLRGNEEKEDLDPCITLCKSLKYSKYNAGTILIRQGEESDGRVYIVMTGEVTVVSKHATIAKEGGFSVLREILANTPSEDEAKNSDKEADTPLEIPEKVADDEPKVERKDSGLSPKKSDSIAESPSVRTLKRMPSMKLTRTRGISNHSQHNSPARAESPSRFKSLANRKGGPDGKSLKGKDMVNLDGKNSFAIATKNEFGVVKDIINEGGYFGDKARKRIRRRATIIANTDVELLSFTDDMMSNLQQFYNLTKQQFLSFLRESFNIDELETDVLLDTMEIFQVSRTDKIVTQGTPGDYLHIIYQGECECLKEVVYDDSSNITNKMGELNVHYRMKKTQKEQIPVGSVSSGSFIGLESFYNDTSQYEFTAKVSSRKAILLGFKKDKVMFRFPRKSFFYMNEKYKPVYQSHLETLKYRLETKGCKLDLLELTKVLPVVRRFGPQALSTKFSIPIQVPQGINDSHEEISLHDHLSMIKSAYPSTRREKSPKESLEASPERIHRRNESKFEDSLLPELAAIMMRSSGAKPLYSPPREEDFKSARKYEIERAAYEKYQLQLQKTAMEKTLKRAAAILNNTSKKNSLKTVPPELRISSHREEKVDLEPERFHGFGKQLNSYLDRVQEHYSGIQKVIQDPNYPNRIPEFKFGFAGPEHLEKLHQHKLGEIKNNFGKKKDFQFASARQSVADASSSNLIKSPSMKQIDSPKESRFGDNVNLLSPSREARDLDPAFYNEYPDSAMNPVLKSLKAFLDTLRSPIKREGKVQMKATVGGFLFDWKAKKKLRNDRSSHDLSSMQQQNHYQSVNYLHSFKNSSVPSSPNKYSGIKKGSTILKRKPVDSFGVMNVHLGKNNSTSNLRS
jgi:CRP-like cAMP-binding protein